MPSPEIFALGIFAIFYIIIRIIEQYVLPIIPDFIRRETSAFLRWGPVLLPILFGFAYWKTQKPKNKKKSKMK
jgi:hypothetical protein